MAELADAHGSGPCGSNTLWVRLPSSASKQMEDVLRHIFFSIHRKLHPMNDIAYRSAHAAQIVIEFDTFESF